MSFFTSSFQLSLAFQIVVHIVRVFVAFLLIKILDLEGVRMHLQCSSSLHFGSDFKCGEFFSRYSSLSCSVSHSSSLLQNLVSSATIITIVSPSKSWQSYSPHHSPIQLYSVYHMLCWHIDKNGVENAIRPLAIGRKNYLFCGSDASAVRASMIYSFISTCKANGVEPREWFEDVIRRIPEYENGRSDVNHLLPKNWKANFKDFNQR